MRCGETIILSRLRVQRIYMPACEAKAKQQGRWVNSELPLSHSDKALDLPAPYKASSQHMHKLLECALKGAGHLPKRPFSVPQGGLLSSLCWVHLNHMKDSVRTGFPVPRIWSTTSCEESSHPLIHVTRTGSCKVKQIGTAPWPSS